MARKKKKTFLSTALTIAVIGVGLWMKYNETREDQRREGSIRDEEVEIIEPKETESIDAIDALLTPVSLSSSRFEILKNCTLKDHRGNDGDSFHVRTPKGEEEVRLYYVDAPESAARHYRNGATNYKRIAEQGVAMGGLDQHQTTQIGVVAKMMVKKLLKGKKFTIATTREKVYGSHRIYAYVIVDWKGKKRYLHELLVAKGLGRIHTKPMILPDNTSSSRHKDKLRKIERFAKKKHYGAWGVKTHS